MCGQEINLIRKQRLTMNDKKDNPTGEREGGTAVNLHPAVWWIQRPSPLTCRLEDVLGDRARLFVVGQRWISDYFKTPVESPLWIVLSRSAAWSAAIPKRIRPHSNVNGTYSGNIRNILHSNTNCYNQLLCSCWKAFLRHLKQEHWNSLVWIEDENTLFRENEAGVGEKKGRPKTTILSCTSRDLAGPIRE